MEIGNCFLNVIQSAVWVPKLLIRNMLQIKFMVFAAIVIAQGLEVAAGTEIDFILLYILDSE